MPNHYIWCWKPPSEPGAGHGVGCKAPTPSGLTTATAYRARFSGRYKAQLVEGSGTGICARLAIRESSTRCAPFAQGEDRPAGVSWSSLAWYLAARSIGRNGFRVDRLLASNGIPTGHGCRASEFERRMEARRLGEAEEGS